MTIRKEATNIIVNVKNEHSSFSGFLMKKADQLNVEATRNNLSLICNRKIESLGKEKNRSQLITAVIQIPLVVEKVNAPKKVVIGKDMMLKVKKYNRRANKTEKEQVRWAVEIDGVIENLNETGHEISIRAKDEWKGKNIIALAYISNVNAEGRSDIIVTITYFKQFPQLKGISTQSLSTLCVPTTMEYINREFGGNYTSNDYLNYYRQNLAANDNLYQLLDGVPLQRMELLTRACFNIQDGISVFDAINQGYPEIWAINRGNGNGHCIAVIGYTSDNSFIIMDPESSSARTVSIQGYALQRLTRLSITGYQQI